MLTGRETAIAVLSAGRRRPISPWLVRALLFALVAVAIAFALASLLARSHDASRPIPKVRKPGGLALVRINHDA